MPASARFEWHVTPSTRPFERKAGRTEAWTLTCEAEGRVLATQHVVVGIGERRTVTPCAQPASSTAVASGAAGASSAPQASRRADALSLRLDRRQRLSTVLRRGLLVRATCALDCTLGTTVRQSRAGMVLGRRSLRLRAGRRAAFRVPLSAAGRRSLVRRRAGVVTLVLDARSAAQRQRFTRTVSLAAR